MSAFVTALSHLIWDHKEATQGIHEDDCYIEKLNAPFFEYKDMAAHIQMVETQDAMLLRCLGMKIAPCTCKDHLRKLLDYAPLLDNCYSKSQAQQRNANNTNVSNGNGNKKVVVVVAHKVVVVVMVVVAETVVVVVATVMADMVLVVAEIIKDMVGPPTALTQNIRKVYLGKSIKPIQKHTIVPAVPTTQT